MAIPSEEVRAIDFLFKQTEERLETLKGLKVMFEKVPAPTIDEVRNGISEHGDSMMELMPDNETLLTILGGGGEYDLKKAIDSLGEAICSQGRKSLILREVEDLLKMRADFRKSWPPKR